MSISYTKLWLILVNMHMTKEALRKVAGISTTSLSKLIKGVFSTTKVLKKISDALNREVTDIYGNFGGW